MFIFLCLLFWATVTAGLLILAPYVALPLPLYLRMEGVEVHWVLVSALALAAVTAVWVFKDNQASARRMAAANEPTMELLLVPPFKALAKRYSLFSAQRDPKATPWL